MTYNPPPTPPPNPYFAPRPEMPTGMYGGSDREEALRQVKGPAIALLVCGIVGMSLGGLSLLSNIAILIYGLYVAQPGVNQPQIALDTGSDIFGAFGATILNAFVLYAGIKMKKLENYGMTMAGSIIAIVTILCCCIWNVPFGIWALVVICKQSVKEHFTASEKFL